MPLSPPLYVFTQTRKVILHHGWFSPFPGFFFFPAEQQLNLQTALNYSTHRAPTEYTGGQVTSHQSQDISRILQTKNVSVDAPSVQLNGHILRSSAARRLHQMGVECICMNQSKGKVKREAACISKQLVGLFYISLSLLVKI